MVLLNNSVAITNLIRFILVKNFIELDSITIVYETLESPSNHELQKMYLNAIETTLYHDLTFNNSYIPVCWIKTDVMTADELNSKLLINAEGGADGYISLVSNVSKFLNAKYYATMNSYLRLRDRKFLFITFDENLEMEIHSMSSILKLYRSHIFLQNNNDSIKMLAQKVLGPDNLKLILIDIYWLSNSTFNWNTVLYPAKDEKLNGQVIRIGTHSIPPFLYVSVMKPGDGNVDSINPNNPKKSIYYDGAEAQILLEFCRIKNCTIRLHYYGKEAWGDIYPNGSSNGVYGGLHNEEVEVGHGLFVDLYSDKFEISNTITKIAVILLTPKPQQYPPYLTVVLPFDLKLWLAFLLTAWLCSILEYVFDYFATILSDQFDPSKVILSWKDSYIKASLKVIAIFLQTSYYSSKFINYSAKIFTGFLLLTTMIIENSYSGQLKSLLTVPLYMNPIDTTEKLIQSNLKWVGPVNKWVLPIALSDLRRDQIISQKFQIMDYAEIRSAELTGKYGVPVGKSYVYNFGDYIRDGNLEDFIRIKDDVFFTYSRIVSRRAWPFMDELNTLILWTLEHGIYMFWENKFADKYLDAKTQRKLNLMEIGNRDPDPPLKLKVANISGPLFILCFGLLTAGIIFIMELGTKKFTKH